MCELTKLARERIVTTLHFLSFLGTHFALIPLVAPWAKITGDDGRIFADDGDCETIDGQMLFMFRGTCDVDVYSTSDKKKISLQSFTSLTFLCSAALYISTWYMTALLGYINNKKLVKYTTLARLNIVLSFLVFAWSMVSLTLWFDLVKTVAWAEGFFVGAIFELLAGVNAFVIMILHIIATTGYR